MGVYKQLALQMKSADRGVYPLSALLLFTRIDGENIHLEIECAVLIQHRGLYTRQNNLGYGYVQPAAGTRPRQRVAS